VARKPLKARRHHRPRDTILSFLVLAFLLLLTALAFALCVVLGLLRRTTGSDASLYDLCRTTFAAGWAALLGLAVGRNSRK
jgi:amino acid transporter